MTAFGIRTSQCWTGGLGDSCPPSCGCGGFGAVQAAEILGVAAPAVTARSQDVTPTTRGCEFSAGDKKISFSLTVEDSIDDAKKDFQNLRETYVIAARAQESATGKALEEGAYSDILSVGDEG